MYGKYIVLLLATLQVFAKPVTIPVNSHVALPFALKFGELKTTLVEHDRSRAFAFKSSAQPGTVKRRSVFVANGNSANITNQFVRYLNFLSSQPLNHNEGYIHCRRWGWHSTYFMYVHRFVLGMTS